MITRMTINDIEAKKTPGKNNRGFDVLFNLEDVKVEGDEVRIKYIYTANYKENAGHIRLRGELVAKEDKDLIKKVEAELKTKKLPPEYMQKVVNAVNYFGTTNATVIAHTMGMVPPIKMPVLQFKQEEQKKSK